MRPFYSSPLANLLLACTPNTKFFQLKRLALRLLGFEILSNAKINGGVKFYGRGRITIGKNSWIGMGVKFINSDAHISIGDNCDLAPFVVLHTGSHQIGPLTRRAGAGTSSNISIGNGCWVGLNSIFLTGSKLGHGCVVGATSTVIKEFNDNTLIVGSPARAIRELA